MTAPWKPGDRLTHRFNPELGTGSVEAIEGRHVVVRFAQSGTSLRLAADTDALKPLKWSVGARARLEATGEEVIVDEIPDDGRVRLTDGREVDESELWPVDHGETLFDRLARGDVDRPEKFALRLDALYLAAIREADGLGSFLGGRIRLFPHQLHAAERATRTDPVRWLLADEVGLGKTVESCLILNRLLRTSRAERTLVVAPATLTVQWLGELWRKYHQVFVLLDDKRLEDVEREFGPGFSPFEAYRNLVVGMDYLIDRPRLTAQAVAAGVDLLIVDEAHHLRRPPGHPGNPAYRAVQPIAALGRHVLLLTATPLDEDAHGFFRLLQLLRPQEFSDTQTFEEQFARSRPLPPCTSATRRQDIGGLPPRVGRPFEIHAGEDWDALHALERSTRAGDAGNAVERRAKLRRIRAALASGPALESLLGAGDADALESCRIAALRDPRIAWIVEHARDWSRAGNKTLIFVAQRETLELIKSELSRKLQLRVGVFHEDLSAGQRDIEVAQFRLAGGPSILISTECGGEGRNFEFCTRMLLFDLPWNPIVVEQRIGRLDRIGRDLPVEIAYPRPPEGLGATLAALYERLGLFERPLGGLDRELAEVEAAVESMALSDEATPDLRRLDALVGGAREAYDRVQQAAHHQLHRDSYRGELAEAILARVPAELEQLTAEVVLAAADQLDLRVEAHREGRRHSIELGTRSRVENLPGVPGGSSFLGSFDRDEAVQDESIDFFASGHPLVEGILAHLEDSPLGRVGLLRISGEAGTGFGLLALYKHGPEFSAVAVDIEGRERPEWAERLIRRPLRSRRVKPDHWTRLPGWPQLVRKLAAALEPHGRPVAIAAFHLE